MTCKPSIFQDIIIFLRYLHIFDFELLECMLEVTQVPQVLQNVKIMLFFVVELEENYQAYLDVIVYLILIGRFKFICMGLIPIKYTLFLDDFANLKSELISI